MSATQEDIWSQMGQEAPASGTPGATSASASPDDIWSRMGRETKPQASAPSDRMRLPGWQQALVDYIPGFGGMARSATSQVAQAEAGTRSLYDLAHGKSLADVDIQSQRYIAEHTAKPTPGSLNDTLSHIADSPYNPASWPGRAMEGLKDYWSHEISEATDPLNGRGTPVAPGISDKAGPGFGTAAPPANVVHISTANPNVGPAVVAGAQFAGQVLPMLGGLRGAGAATAGEAAGSEASAAASAAGRGMQSRQAMGAAPVGEGALTYDPLSQPVKGGLPPEAEAARVKALQDVGITQARASAITGDAAQAAVDANIAKFEKEPAGRAAGTHFQQHETGPLTQYAQNTVTEQGGSLGLDEDALYRRGTIIATPFDRFRDWLSAQIDGLYTEARNRGNTTPPTQLGRLNELLNGTTPESLDFQGQLGASQDGERLLNAARSKLERDLAANPQGLNATQAENTRKFFNSDGVWSSDRSWAINRMHQAMDYDVAEAAGSDLFERARGAYQAREQLLNDPRGILKLFDKDPNTPINRATPYAKLPDALINLDPDQLQHVMNVLQDMQHIPELAPDANAALGEIRGHYVNRVLEQGSMTRGGAGVGRTPKPYWDADAVNKYLADTGRRRGIIFDGAPDAEGRIEKLQNAGNVLKVDPSYRGAAAQASTALKSGLASALFEHAGPWVGEAIGSMLGAPGLGGIAGSYAGRAAAVRAAEARGMSGWNRGIRDIGEAPPQPPRTPPGAPPPPRTPPGSAPSGGAPAAPATPSAGNGVAPPPAQPPSPRAQEVAATMSRLRTWDQPAATRAEHTRRLQQVAEESPEVAAAVGPRPGAAPPKTIADMKADAIARAMAGRSEVTPTAAAPATSATRTMAPPATRSEPAPPGVLSAPLVHPTPRSEMPPPPTSKPTWDQEWRAGMGNLAEMEHSRRAAVSAGENGVADNLQKNIDNVSAYLRSGGASQGEIDAALSLDESQGLAGLGVKMGAKGLSVGERGVFRAQTAKQMREQAEEANAPASEQSATIEKNAREASFEGAWQTLRRAKDSPGGALALQREDGILADALREASKAGIDNKADLSKFLAVRGFKDKPPITGLDALRNLPQRKP